MATISSISVNAFFIAMLSESNYLLIDCYA
jgi:hypothetical protein